MASSCGTNYKLLSCNNAFNQASSYGFDMPSVGKQLCPTKTVRVAMLKTRFADIISKAQQTLNNNGEKEDPARMRPEKVDFVENQQKKKRRIESQVKDDKAAITRKANSELKMKIEMERDASFIEPEKEGIDQVRMLHEKEDFAAKQHEKKRRIEAQVKAPKATTNNANYERKMKIEKEREATRLALEKVEASIYIDDFNQTYKEFFMLISSQSGGVR